MSKEMERAANALGRVQFRRVNVPKEVGSFVENFEVIQCLWPQSLSSPGLCHGSSSSSVSSQRTPFEFGSTTAMLFFELPVLWLFSHRLLKQGIGLACWCFLLSFVSLWIVSLLLSLTVGHAILSVPTTAVIHIGKFVLQKLHACRRVQALKSKESTSSPVFPNSTSTSTSTSSIIPRWHAFCESLCIQISTNPLSPFVVVCEIS